MRLENNKILITTVSSIIGLGLIVFWGQGGQKLLIIFLLINYKLNKSTNDKIYEEELSENKYKSNLIIEDNNTTMLDDELEDEGEERIFPVEDDQEIIVLPNPNINEAVILKKLWNKKLKSSILKIMLINKIELFLFIYGV